MARIKRINKVNKNMNVYEEITERRVDRSFMETNALNNKKFCNNDRNRRMLLTLKSYSNLFQSNYFSNNIQHAVEKSTINVFTQTSDSNVSNERTKISSFTQTQDIHAEVKKSEKYSKNEVRKSKSDSFLLVNHTKRKHKKMGYLSELRANEMRRKRNIRQIKTSPITETWKQGILASKGRRSKNRNRIKTKKTKMCSKRNTNLYDKKGNTMKNTLLKNENITSSQHKFNEKIGNFNLTIIAEWSSKIFRLFSDLGISLTESILSLYRYYESQKYQAPSSLCNCQQKINRLEIKLESLESIMHNLAEHTQTKNTDLEEKIEEIKRKLESYDYLRTELATLKKQLNKETPTRCAPPVVPPPPPLPPPLPVFPLSNGSTKPFVNVVQNERKSINYENPRPIITLEDILKVKLKKTSATNI